MKWYLSSGIPFHPDFPVVSCIHSRLERHQLCVSFIDDPIYVFMTWLSVCQFYDSHATSELILFRFRNVLWTENHLCPNVCFGKVSEIVWLFRQNLEASCLVCVLLIIPFKQDIRICHVSAGMASSPTLTKDIRLPRTETWCIFLLQLDHTAAVLRLYHSCIFPSNLCLYPLLFHVPASFMLNWCYSMAAEVCSSTATPLLLFWK